MGTPQSTTIDPARELRAEIARQMVPIYRLAPRVGLHPAHLGQVLRGRRSLSPELATRIQAAISEAAQDRPTPSVPA